MSFTRGLAVAVVVLAAGCDPSGVTAQAPRLLRHRSAIVGGTVDSADPAVVGFAVGDGRYFSATCTGTLVAPKTVVTAAHCIYADGRNNDYYAIFGTYDSHPSEAIKIIAQYANPAYNGDLADVGIARLETAATVTPIAMNPTPLTDDDIGKIVRHVGYGITASNLDNSGTKREVSFPIRDVQALTIESGAVGKQTCSGDSGGPALMVTAGSSAERLIGTVSYGDETCTDYGIDMRVDAYLSWFQQKMSAWEDPNCAADGTCSAECADAANDPDCPHDCTANGVCALDACPRPDPDCVATGNPCSSELLCLSRRCVNDAQNSTNYCASDCSNGQQCADGTECVDGSCRFKQKPERQLLDPCDSAYEFCTNNTVCTGPSDGMSRCVKTCDLTSECPNGSTCEGGKGGQRYCRPADVSFEPLKPISLLNDDVGPAAGCSSAPGSAGLLFGVLLVLRRRRGA